MDYSPSGSSVHGIFQERILEWVAISFSRVSSQPRDRNQVSCIAGGCFNLWATREAPSKSSLFILFMGFSRQEYWSGLPFPSPVDHVLSEFSTMTRPSWVALNNMAHSFIELDKAVAHMIRLVSFLWLWFSVCLPFDGEGYEAYGSFLMGETDWGENWVLFWCSSWI